MQTGFGKRSLQSQGHYFQLFDNRVLRVLEYRVFPIVAISDTFSLFVHPP